MVCSRGMASSSKPPPEERAAEIINTLPSSPNLVTKTGSVVLGTGLLATAISQQLYVVNEETVIAAGFFILISFIYKVCLVLYWRHLFPFHPVKGRLHAILVASWNRMHGHTQRVAYRWYLSPDHDYARPASQWPPPASAYSPSFRCNSAVDIC